MKHMGSVIIFMSDPFSMQVANNDMGIPDRHGRAGLHVGTRSEMGMTK